MAKGQIRVGIGGWDFDPWRDNFYPKGLAKAKQLGFAADKPGDLVPEGVRPILAIEEGETYRSIDYMYDETVRLARQLKKIGGNRSSSTGRSLGSVPPKLSKS